MTTVNQYRVWCTTPVAHYEFVWGTTEPTVCPSDGGPIDTSLTTVVQSIKENGTTVDNFPFTSTGSFAISDTVPLIQITFVYGIRPQTIETVVTGTGAITNPNNVGLVSTGASINSSAKLSTITPLKYRTGEDLVVRVSGVFTLGVVGSTQMIGGFDDINGLGFGYNGAIFGVFHRNASVTTWIPQTSWNIDPFDGSGPSGSSINFGDGFGNLFQVIYRYHGFGSLFYYVENPSNGQNSLVHIIRYENTSALTNFSDPSFPLGMQVINTTNNTNVQLSCAGILGAIRGKVSSISDPTFIYEWNNIPVQNGTETAGFSFRFPATFNGVPNRVIVFILKFTSATNSNDRPQRVRIRKNATITGAVWTDVDAGQSVAQRLTSGTWTASTGNIVNVDLVAGGGLPTVVKYESGSNNSILGLRNETFTFTFEGVGGGGSNNGSITWVESQ